MRKSSRKQPPYNVTITKYLTYTSSDSNQSNSSGGDKKHLTKPLFLGNPVPKPRGSPQVTRVFPQYLDTIEELSEENSITTSNRFRKANDPTKSKIEMSSSDNTLSKDSDKRVSQKDGSQQSFPTAVHSASGSATEFKTDSTAPSRRSSSGSSSSHLPIAIPRDVDDDKTCFAKRSVDSLVSSTSSIRELQPVMTSTPASTKKAAGTRSEEHMPSSCSTVDKNEKSVNSSSDNIVIKSPLETQEKEQSVAQTKSPSKTGSIVKSQTINVKKKISTTKAGVDKDDNDADDDRAITLKDSLQLYSNSEHLSPLYFLRMKHKKTLSSDKINVSAEDNTNSKEKDKSLQSDSDFDKLSNKIKKDSSVPSAASTFQSSSADIENRDSQNMDITKVESASEDTSSDLHGDRSSEQEMQKSVSEPSVPTPGAEFSESVKPFSKSELRKLKAKKSIQSKSKGINKMLSLALFNRVMKSSESQTQSPSSTNEQQNDSETAEENTSSSDNTVASAEDNKQEEHDDSMAQEDSAAETVSLEPEKETLPSTGETHKIKSADLTSSFTPSGGSSVIVDIGDHVKHTVQSNLGQRSLSEFNSFVASHNSPLSPGSHTIIDTRDKEQAETEVENVDQKLDMTDNTKEITEKEGPETKKDQNNFDLDYTSPSKLLGKTIDREKTGISAPSYGHFEFTSPSQLLKMYTEREDKKHVEAKKSLNTEDRFKDAKSSPGYGQFDYTSPSKLLSKINDRKKISAPGYGHFDFTSPSQLMQKYAELTNSENKMSTSELGNKTDKRRENSDRIDHTPGYGHFDYSSPSQLHSKINDRENTGKSAPSYGHFDFISPSQLLTKYTELKNTENKIRAQELEQASKKDKRETTDSSPGYGQFDYSSPSQLYSKIRDRENTGMSTPSYGHFDFISPSQLLKKYTELKNVENKIRAQELEQASKKDKREMTDSSPGYGQFDYSSPSQLYSKIRDREKTGMSTPSYGHFDFTSPSQLLKKYSELKNPGNKTSSTHIEDKTSVDVKSDNASTQDFNADSVNETSRYTRPVSENDPGYYFFMDAIISDLSQKLHSLTSFTTSTEASTNGGDESNVSGHDVDVGRPVDGTSTSQISSPQQYYSDQQNRESPNEPCSSVGGASSGKSHSLAEDLTEPAETSSKSQNMLKNQQPVLSDITNYFTSLSQFFLNAAIHSGAMSEPGFIEHLSEQSSESLPGENSIDRMIWDLLTSRSVDSAVEHSITRMKKEGRIHSRESGFESGSNVPSDESNKQYTEEKILHTSAIDFSPHVPATQYSNDSAYNASVSSIESNLDHTADSASVFDMLQKVMALKQKQVECSQSSSSAIHNVEDSENKLSQADKDDTQFETANQVTLTYNPSFTCYSDDSDDDTDKSVSHSIEGDNLKKISGQSYTSPIEKVILDPIIHGSSTSTELSSSSTMNRPSTSETKGYSDHVLSEVGSLPKIKTNMRNDQSPAPGTRAPPPSVSSMSEQFLSDYLLNIQSFKHSAEHSNSTSPSLPVPTTDQLVAYLALTLLAQLEPLLFQQQHDRGQKSQTTSHSSVSDSRNFMLEKEVMESQCRKLQVENNTLHTENKRLKEKYNRSTVKVSELEDELYAAKAELDVLQNTVTQELSDARKRGKNEYERELEQLKTRNLVLTKDNQSLKSEVSHLEKDLGQLQTSSELTRQNSERNRTLEAYKMEISSLKEELSKVKSLLHQCEGHLADEKDRCHKSSEQIVKLTEMKNLLQQQLDSGSSSVIVEKQMNALEKRLKITEERLHQERGDRANNLSLVEDKLLTENARLQASEKENMRQLNREKEKNKNLDQRIRDLRDENQRLRLSLPIDDTAPLKDSFDIPYGVHGNQRFENKKISADIKYIMGQIEKQEGLKNGQEKDIICELWNKKENAYRKVKEYETQLKELDLDDSLSEGLKNLQEIKDQYETKLEQLEEKYHNMKSEKETYEKTYKEQLSTLVKERHEAQARLTTSNDLLEAIKNENEMLRKGMSGVSTSMGSDVVTPSRDGRVDALSVEVRNLEGKVAQLNRKNQLLNGELDTLKAQLSAREKALEDAQFEMEKSQGKWKEDDGSVRKQQKIDQLSVQVSEHQAELRTWSERMHVVNAEKCQLERQVEDLKRKLKMHEARQETKKAESTAKQLQTMELDLTDKESQIMKTSAHLQCTEMELSKMKQELHSCQEHSADLSSQVDSLQNQLDQRTQILDMLGASENEKLCQIQMLKDSLDSVNQQLSAKQARVNILEVELSREEDKAEKFQKELLKYRKHTEDDILSQQNHGEAIRKRQIDMERDNLKCEILQLTTSKDAMRREIDGMNNEIHDMVQKLNQEKANTNCILTEKAELEKRLELIVEERNALLEEKNQGDEDLVKLENKLQHVLHKFEVEARRQHETVHTKYTEIPPETRKLFGEIDGLKILVEGKDKEIEMLQDKLGRYKSETNFLNRKIVLLSNEIQCNREDITRLSGVLSLKMRENTATVEMNQYLDAERTKLQKENYQLQKHLDKERDSTQQNKIEVEEIVRKIENTETLHRNKESELNKKDIYLCELETQLKHAEKNVSYLDNENKESKAKIKSLNEEVQSLSSVNLDLEKKIQNQKHVLEEEKNNACTQQDELTNCRQKLEILKHENTVIFNSLNAEKQNLDKMKETLQSSEENSFKLKEQISSLQCELESQKREVDEWKDKVEHLTQEKSGVYTEYTDVCRKLNEKDQAILSAEEKLSKNLENLEKSFSREKARLEDEKASLTRDLMIAREERKELNEKIRQKDLQLNNFGRTLQDLEDISREKKTLEMKVEKLESSHGDSKVLLESHRSEVMSLKEANRQTQETYQKLQVSNYALQEELRSHKDISRIEISDLKHRLEDAQKHHETEKSSLKEILGKTQSCLQSAEHDLNKIKESRDDLSKTNKFLERSLDESKTKLNEEVVGRKLAEQKNDTVKTQMEEMKKKVDETQQRYVEMQRLLPKIESDLKTEIEKTKQLSEEKRTLESATFVHESNASNKKEQVEVLQTEMSKLRLIIENQKQQMNVRLKKTTGEMKHQMDTVEEDRNRLNQQLTQIKIDLEKSRDLLQEKNKENLKLQEQILSLENEVREGNSKIRVIQDSLRMEEEMQMKMSFRYQEQEDEMKRLKSFMSKKAEQSGDGEKSLWVEMTKVIQDLSLRMNQHIDLQKSTDKGALDREAEKIAKYKKQIGQLETELHTEKALHNITKGSLQALEEDCQRLRLYLHSSRKRDTSQKKTKSRMEEINERIAKSQARAQALISSGMYNVDGSYAYSPPTHDPGNLSPDDSVASDSSFMGIPPLNMSFQASPPKTFPPGALSPRNK